MEKYADVILPLAVDESFTYAVPEEMAVEVQVGVRVVVPLGHRKYYTGIVQRIHEIRPPYRRVKTIASVVDRKPIVGPVQLRFWEWLADYYMCSIGEVMKSAIPAALKSDGFTENIRESYTVKTETHITLHPSIGGEEELHLALDSLTRAKAQYRSLLMLSEQLNLVDWANKGSVAKKRFVYGGYGSYAILKNLEEKQLIESIEVEISRYRGTDKTAAPLPELTTHQRQAFGKIQSDFAEDKTVLLHGVTGSGKTEIYIHLIQEVLEKGRDALYLLPEIALTTQLIERLQNYFVDRVIVYHSRFNENMRAECYLNLLKEGREPMLVLGVRSSLLLPHHNLGIIIVDEEHENSYKQQEPAPRYHARDSAVMLAHLCGAHVLLGSATPSVESYYNAVSGKYGLAVLNERFGGAVLPRIVVTDMMRAAKRGEKISHFSRLLLEKTGKALEAGEQVILFQNRRGFAPYIECGACYSIPSCPHCNVSLTYHKQEESLVCHYCGYTTTKPKTCPHCGSEALQARGFGTEKIEEELQPLLPEARIARLDLDSTRSANAYTRIISAFDAGRIDILVGTQMVTKGFDFDRVTLVGVLNADNLLNFPDFRASERSFQLMMQVAGRAGRREKEGNVIIQTTQPEHPVLEQIKKGDYEAMFRGQIAERRRFLYPPFCRLIRFTLKHPDKEVLNRAVKAFEPAMRRIFGRRLLGPERPVVDKIRDEYLCHFLLKIEREKSFAEAKTLARELIRQLQETKGYGALGIIADVDPQ